MLRVERRSHDALLATQSKLYLLMCILIFRYVVTGSNTSPLIRHLKREHKDLFVQWWWSLEPEKQRALRSKSEYSNVDRILAINNQSAVSSKRSKNTFFDPVSTSHVLFFILV